MLCDGKASPHQSILLVQSPQRAAIRAGDWKLLQSQTAAATNDKAGKKNNTKAAKKKAKQTDDTAPQIQAGPELYNLREDPSETQNIAQAHPEIVARLSSQLNQLLLNAVPPGNPVEP
jgi:hypothetical protein